MSCCFKINLAYKCWCRFEQASLYIKRHDHGVLPKKPQVPALPLPKCKIDHQCWFSYKSVSFFLGPHSDSRLKNSSHSFGRTGWNLQCFIKYFKTQYIWFFKRYKPAVLILHSDQMDFKLLLCGPWDVDPNELLQKLALNKNYKNGQCSCNKTHQILINCRSLWSMNINERMPFQVFIIWVKFSPN